MLSASQDQTKERHWKTSYEALKFVCEWQNANNSQSSRIRDRNIIKIISNFNVKFEKSGNYKSSSIIDSAARNLNIFRCDEMKRKNNQFSKKTRTFLVIRFFSVE